jgi:phosphatidylinositol glycan class O
VGLQAFLGDTTWGQLFPRAWAWSRPYPCFNVRDLHTVDDGIAQHLPAALAQPEAWSGLLVAHYLGVDHCGHSYGVGSPEMAAKLK